MAEESYSLRPETVLYTVGQRGPKLVRGVTGSITMRPLYQAGREAPIITSPRGGEAGYREEQVYRHGEDRGLARITCLWARVLVARTGPQGGRCPDTLEGLIATIRPHPRARAASRLPGESVKVLLPSRPLYMVHPVLLSRLEAEMLARSTILSAKCCVEHGLRCVDPPAATSRLLEWLGYGHHRIRTFWSRLEEAAPVRVEVYRYRGVRFWVVVLHRLEPLREMSSGEPCPLGELDWEGREHRFAPSAHVARVYLEGGVGGNGVRMNAVRLLCMMERSAPGSLSSLESLVLGLVWGRLGRGEAATVISGLVGRWAGILGGLLPTVPVSPQRVLEIVPFVRKLQEKHEGVN